MASRSCERAPFGDLDLDAARVDTGLAKHRGDVADDVGLAHEARREVHAHRERIGGRTRCRPPARPETRLAQHEPIDRHDQARFLGDGDEGRGRRAAPRCGWFQRSNASAAITSSARQRHLGLEEHDELPALERPPHVALELEPLHHMGRERRVEELPTARDPSPWRRTSRGRPDAAGRSRHRRPRARARYRRLPTRTARARRSRAGRASLR